MTEADSAADPLGSDDGMSADGVADAAAAGGLVVVAALVVSASSLQALSVPASSAVARAANFVATESRAGILRLRAASVPTATISAQYHIITAATAAKEG